MLIYKILILSHLIHNLFDNYPEYIATHLIINPSHLIFEITSLQIQCIEYLLFIFSGQGIIIRFKLRVIN